MTVGGEHSFALRANGSFEAWGRDLEGQVSNAPPGTGFDQVAGGYYHSLALRVDGSIESWGYDSTGQVSNTPPGTGFVQVAGGGYHSLALRVDGSIESWGYGGGGLSNTPPGTGFDQVAGGGYHSVALRADGSIESWGSDSYGLVSNTPPGTGFVQVSAGWTHSVALRADGSIESWGRDLEGQVSNTPASTGFVQVAAGGKHSVAIHGENSGVPYCFGDGSGSSCPCSAFGGTGEGCANTGGMGATLTGAGNASFGGDSLVLNIVGVPGAKPGLVLKGDNQVAIPAGDGILCTSGGSLRSHVQVTDVSGATTYTNFNGVPFGAISNAGGAPTNYQFWYRDPANTCSGAGFNFSNAWAVTWLP